MGYLVYDLIFCVYYSDDVDEGGMAAMYAHHFLAIFGASASCWLGGILGSISQLTWITEFSTPFVNLRVILAQHELSNSRLYAINGILMTVAFFLARVVFYYYMIFNVLLEYFIYRGDVTWAMYEPHQYNVIKLAVLGYFAMYCLNMFWFSRMLQGFLKGAGCLDRCFKSKVDDE